MSRLTFTTGQHRTDSITNDIILNGTISELKFNSSLKDKILLTDQTRTWLINQNAGGFKLTNLGNGTVSGDAVNFGQMTTALDLKLDDTQLKTFGAGEQQINWGTAGDSEIPSALAVKSYLTSSAVVIVSEEIPSGAKNGVNTEFTISQSPVSGSVIVYLNGQRLLYGLTKDYTVSNQTITLSYAIDVDDVLVATYTYTQSGQESIIVSFTQQVDFGNA